jgi:hypothetical protein
MNPPTAPIIIRLKKKRNVLFEIMTSRHRCASAAAVLISRDWSKRKNVAIPDIMIRRYFI